MLAEANREIRRQLELAELRRAQLTNSPFAYLDQLIAALENLHLDDLQMVPASFLPAVRTANRLLPRGVAPMPEGGGLIRDTIEQCFTLQEALLALRRHRMLGGSSEC